MKISAVAQYVCFCFRCCGLTAPEDTIPAHQKPPAEKLAAYLKAERAFKNEKLVIVPFKLSVDEAQKLRSIAGAMHK
jgi:hypothetical protein